MYVIKMTVVLQSRCMVRWCWNRSGMSIFVCSASVFCLRPLAKPFPCDSKGPAYTKQFLPAILNHLEAHHVRGKTF